MLVYDENVIELFPQFSEAIHILPFNSLGKGEQFSESIPSHFYQIWDVASHIS